LVFRNDEIDPGELKELLPASLVISPGPGTPEDSRYFGLSLTVLRELSPRIPSLGVCLGHQGIAAAFGGEIVGSRTLLHGKTSEIRHDHNGIFTGIPDPFPAARYHSLVIDPDTFPHDTLEVTATTEDRGTIMALRHRSQPLYGIQFHPESVMTKAGPKMIENWLSIVGDEDPVALAE
ncbi:MAG: aminodeoxychorismate/anthranilate synthase component II, partial [Candidatus Bipolaricaulia bacterium]